MVEEVRREVRQRESSDASVFGLVEVQLVLHADPVRLRWLPVHPPQETVARDRRERIGLQNAGGKVGENRLALLLLLCVCVEEEPQFLRQDRAADICLVSMA